MSNASKREKVKRKVGRKHGILYVWFKEPGVDASESKRMLAFEGHLKKVTPNRGYTGGLNTLFHHYDLIEDDSVISKSKFEVEVDRVGSDWNSDESKKRTSSFVRSKKQATVVYLVSDDVAKEKIDAYEEMIRPLGKGCDESKVVMMMQPDDKKISEQFKQFEEEFFKRDYLLQMPKAIGSDEDSWPEIDFKGLYEDGDSPFISLQIDSARDDIANILKLSIEELSLVQEIEKDENELLAQESQKTTTKTAVKFGIFKKSGGDEEILKQMQSRVVEIGEILKQKTPSVGELQEAKGELVEYARAIEQLQTHLAEGAGMTEDQRGAFKAVHKMIAKFNQHPKIEGDEKKMVTSKDYQVTLRSDFGKAR